jgi:hypothetical protein
MTSGHQGESDETEMSCAYTGPERRRRPRRQQWMMREDGVREFFSLSPSAMYLPRYFEGLAQEVLTRLPPVGIAAAIAVVTTMGAAYTQLWWTVAWLWAADVGFGTLRALVRGGFRWTKLGDGFLRGVVIVVLPPLLAAVGEHGGYALTEILGVEIQPERHVVTVLLAVLLVAELGSLLDQAAGMHAGVQRFKDLIYRPGPTKSPGETET